jgi:hypothetical protein
MSTTTGQRPQFCCRCLKSTTSYFTNRVEIRDALGEIVDTVAFHICWDHGEIAVGDDWLAAQREGKTTFAVEVTDYDTGESRTDTIWLSLWRAIQRLEIVRASDVQVDICVERDMTGSYLYDTREPVSA